LTNPSPLRPRHVHRIEGLQICRAIAVLLVGWLHVDQATRAAQAAVTLNVVRAGNIGMFGVDIFFVISGFILGSTALRAASGEPRVEAYDFIARRILRIFPIYWIVILFPLFRELHQHRLTGLTFLDYWLLLPGFSYPETQLIIGLAWTLIFEMVFYYVMAIFMRFTLRHAVRNTIAALIVLVAVGVIVDIRRPILNILMNPILLEFVFGGFAALAFQKLGRRRAAGIVTLIAGLIIIGTVMIHTTYNVALEQNVLAGHNILPRVGTWGIGAWLLVSGVVFWGPHVKSKLGKVLVALGNGSYSIYLTSAISIELITRIMGKASTKSVIEGPIQLRELVAVMCLVMIGMLFYWMIERPLGKRLNATYSLIKQRANGPLRQIVEV
jgi:exopolysaccharide production protein ExoZ